MHASLFHTRRLGSIFHKCDKGPERKLKKKTHTQTHSFHINVKLKILVPIDLYYSSQSGHYFIIAVQLHTLDMIIILQI